MTRFHLAGWLGKTRNSRQSSNAKKQHTEGRAKISKKEEFRHNVWAQRGGARIAKAEYRMRPAR